MKVTNGNDTARGEHWMKGKEKGRRGLGEIDERRKGKKTLFLIEFYI